MNWVDPAEMQGWLKHAAEHGFNYILVVKDLTDRVIFPIYVEKEAAAKRMERCFISESKMKVLDIIKCPTAMSQPR